MRDVEPTELPETVSDKELGRFIRAAIEMSHAAGKPETLAFPRGVEWSTWAPRPSRSAISKQETLGSNTVPGLS